MIDVRQNVRSELLPFAERLTQAVSGAGGTRRISNVLGVSRATLDRWLNAQSEPSFRDVASLAEACAVSLNWLAGSQDSLNVETKRLEDEPDRSLPGVFQVPILDVRAAAGTGAINSDEVVVAHLPFPRSFLKALGVNPDKVRALHAYGDSMEPTVPDGRLVLVDLADRDISRPRVYVIRTPDGLRLKRIQRLLDGSLRLLSDNSELYPPETIAGADVESIKVLGRAFWTEKLL